MSEGVQREHEQEAKARYLPTVRDLYRELNALQNTIALTERHLIDLKLRRALIRDKIADKTPRPKDDDVLPF